MRQKPIKQIRKPSFGRCVCLIDLNLISLSLFCFFYKKLSVSLRFFFLIMFAANIKGSRWKNSIQVFSPSGGWGRLEWRTYKCVKLCLFLINAATNSDQVTKLLLPVSPTPPTPALLTHLPHLSVLPWRVWEMHCKPKRNYA